LRDLFFFSQLLSKVQIFPSRDFPPTLNPLQTRLSFHERVPLDVIYRPGPSPFPLILAESRPRICAGSQWFFPSIRFPRPSFDESLVWFLNFIFFAGSPFPLFVLTKTGLFISLRQRRSLLIRSFLFGRFRRLLSEVLHCVISFFPYSFIAADVSSVTSGHLLSQPFRAGRL